MDNKLKILLINRWLGYNQGGNETHMQDLVRWFARQGHDVTIITTQGEALSDINLNAQIFYINTPKGYFSYGPLGLVHAALFLLKSFFKVAILYFKGNRFDVVSVHFSLEAFLARFLKLFFGYPYVFLLAGDTYLEILEGKRADGAIHISDFMNEQSKKMGYSAAVIPKGFDIDIFSPNYDVSKLKRLHKSKPDTKILLTVCRLDPRKNLISLIEAMDILVHRKKKTNIKLIIIGDGVERQFLENSVTRYGLENYITFLGAVSNKDPLLASYYVLADLFVLPTLYEGFGWVYYEAMACGTPVLTTRVGSNPEVVGDAGILIEPKKPEVLAKAITEMLADKKLLKELIEKGYGKAHAIPWEKQIQKYEVFYNKIKRKNTKNIKSKITTTWYIIRDSFNIMIYLAKGSLFNKTPKNESVWTGSGQSGIKT